MVSSSPLDSVEQAQLPSAARVLLVDADSALCEAIAGHLGPRGFRFDRQSSVEAALAVLEATGSSAWDVVVANARMTDVGGLGLCERIAARFPDLPVVLLTAVGSLDTAIDAVRAHAFDYIVKPFEMNVLAHALDRVLSHRPAREEIARLREASAHPVEVPGIIGASPPMRRVHELIDRVAATEIAVLIHGESGTGKALAARALHERGRRGHAPYVTASCAGLPEEALERELFGAAVAGDPAGPGGVLLEASGGTLFLDEIADLPPAMQYKLLGVLQDRVVRPVGSDEEHPYDARLLTATCRDLETEVSKHRFREDLFYRVHVIQIDVPALRTRGDDILLLAQHFVMRAAAEQRRPVRGVSGAAAAKLLAYPWPGNVRELESCIARAVAVARTEEILIDDLPENVREALGGNHHAAPPPAELLTLEEVERRHILQVLAAVGGRKAAAAEVLGLHPSTLYRKLDHYGGEGGHTSGQGDSEAHGETPVEK